MKIIDFKRKGNVIRFYLGEYTDDWGWTRSDFKDFKGNTPDWLEPSEVYYGDDWNDRPYECNAGEVYDEFIKGYKDITVKFDDVVLEPCDGEWNSSWCKNDMVNRKVPCIIIVPYEVWHTDAYTSEPSSFRDWVGSDQVIKYYFGDELGESK